ncbi:hypothetical protein QYE76_054115 [Lolium multiflorum]|uniref:Uncharacterized protein n=1 Tax=Lolium multiflorum TaxID=4521 RepID=A0AAD8SX22_LOLMU|nr:hypothetical protein QYE76_054115 [Lolium multiflorum]
MEFTHPTYRLPATVRERKFPAGVIVENQLRVWTISRGRTASQLAEYFLSQGYRHLNLPRGTPPMFQLEGYFDGGNGEHEIGLTIRFVNPHDAFYLLGKVFWCGCEFIAFTTYNIFTNFRAIFPSHGNMHSLPYNF